jgi:UDP-N-acetyl-D-mannosaminuronic acid dehydrogenase
VKKTTSKTAMFNRVSVLGLGYVGLPMAAIMAARGVEVIGVDVTPSVVAKINEGGIHIVEPGLDIVVRGAVGAGKLRATATPEPADAFIIAVPTPFKDGYVPDVSYCEAAARAIAPVVQAGDLVVLESTSPVGTTDKFCAWLAQLRPDLTFPNEVGENADIQVAYCPERVLPGRVLLELVANDRIIGGMTPLCAQRAQDLYQIFVQGTLHLTDARSAEMVKLTENAFRDVNIAFANELSLLCERFELDVWEVIDLANRHPRVNILKPGPGVGGHCISVDPWFIVDSAPDLANLIRTAREVNDGKPEHVLAKVRSIAQRFKEPVIACLGLSFKPDIDDLRESPALHIAERLADAQLGQLAVVEPHISELPPSLRGRNQVRLTDVNGAIKPADIVLLLVDHKQFRRVDRQSLREKVVIDTRGIWR